MERAAADYTELDFGHYSICMVAVRGAACC